MTNNDSKLGQPVAIKSTRDLGNLVREFRVAQKLTQADILGLANTGNRFIVELENGKPTVQFQKVLDVLDTLGLEIVIQKKGSF
ncbi:MAG: transcriptional regulator [Betaproteobacteria bacterium HGW-Betaproteobacteria-8]|jgi:y4mF family transcriptional regulator|nr:MAG: transcriptional regulator [Betaproteobacteria bacterium HGW-Betaproteobacteria-8]